MANEKVYEPVGTTMAIGSLSPCYVSIGSIGFAGRDAIENTCLSNTEFITKQPQTLKESSDIPFTAWGDLDDYDAIEAEINVNQSFTFSVPSVGSVVIWGFLQSFESNETGVGEAWQATGNIVVTNCNGSGVETGPAYTAA